jgi:hypothetical protein
MQKIPVFRKVKKKNNFDAEMVYRFYLPNLMHRMSSVLSSIRNKPEARVNISWPETTTQIGNWSCKYL